MILSKRIFETLHHSYAIVDSATAALSYHGKRQNCICKCSCGIVISQLATGNSIETWSASGITTTTGGTVNYDHS
ncbi:MAG: hypothetical protein R2942_13740 [Ignavibacteria bacterium]